MPFAKKCNEILEDNYAGEGFSIDRNIEFNDGCGMQFKCIRAFTSLARRDVKSSCIFTKTSHRKSKSDGLGGAFKSFASRAVCGERRVIIIAEELMAFFKEALVVKSAVEIHRPMLKSFHLKRMCTSMRLYPFTKWWVLILSDGLLQGLFKH